MPKGTWQKKPPLGKFGGHLWACIPLCFSEPTGVKDAITGKKTTMSGGVYLPIFVEVGTLMKPGSKKREWAICYTSGNLGRKKPLEWKDTKDWWWWSIPIAYPANPSPVWQKARGKSKSLVKPAALTHADARRVSREFLNTIKIEAIAARGKS